MSGAATPEQHGDALEDAAAALAASLAAEHSTEPIAVFLALSRTSASIAEAAGELAKQGPFDAGDPEIADQWRQAMASFKTAEGLFKWIAEGWI